MPTDMSFFTAADAGVIVTNAFGAVTDNFGAVALVIGAMVGLGIVGSMINGGLKGKLRFGRR